MRGIAITAVIILHVIGIPALNYFIASNFIISAFASVGVPLFLFVSGFVLAGNHENNMKWIPFWMKRLKQLIPPYIIFVTVYYILYRISFNPLQINTYGHSILVTYAYELVSGQHQLWFIPLILQLYIIFPILNKLVKKNPNKLLIVAAAVTTISVIFCGSIIDLINYMFQSESIRTFLITMNHRLFIYYLLYFVLGMYVNQKYSTITTMLTSRNTTIVLVSTVIMLALTQALNWTCGVVLFLDYTNVPLSHVLPANIIDTYLYSLFSILLLSLCIKPIVNKSKVIQSLGRYSFGIYLIHLVFIYLLAETMRLFLGITPVDMVYYPICFFGAIVPSFYITKLIAKFKYHEYIIGK